MCRNGIGRMQVGDRARFGNRFWIVRLPKGYWVVDVKEGCRMTHFSRQTLSRLFDQGQLRTAC